MTAPRPGGAPPPPGELLPPTTAVADVLALRGRHGWLSPPLRPFVPGVTGETPDAAGATGGSEGDGVGAVGTARTVALAAGPGGLAPLYDLLSGDLAGQVLVLAAPDDAVAVWGELLAIAAARAGASAVLVAGAVRDVGACRRVGLPLWARAARTVGPAGRLEVAAAGEPVRVGATAVRPGDAVVVDADGVVALPAGEAPAVLSDARAYAEGERRVEAALRAGTPLREAYRHKADAVARLRAGEPPVR